MSDTSSSATGTEPLIARLRRATLGRYDIYAELGSGGMATVYLALDLALDRKVAIKVLSPQLATAPDNVARFRREAKVAAALDHPNIIGILAVGEDPSLAFFVMKYVEGRALDSVIQEEGAQSIPFVRSVIASAGHALDFAHQRGVIHRDVKPANLMLDLDGRLIVTDFGIAKHDDASALTITGSVIGTPYYMSPEQFNGQPVTGATDQYALGVVAFELLAGRQPYPGVTVGEVMRGHLFDPIPSVRSLRADVPEVFDAAISRMLAKDPADRFASLEDAVHAITTDESRDAREARTEIIALARSGARQRPEIRVPLSPAPAVRGRARDAAPTVPMDAPRRRRGGLWLSLALAIGAGAATVGLRPDLAGLGPWGTSQAPTTLASAGADENAGGGENPGVNAGGSEGAGPTLGGAEGAGGGDGGAAAPTETSGGGADIPPVLPETTATERTSEQTTPTPAEAEPPTTVPTTVRTPVRRPRRAVAQREADAPATNPPATNPAQPAADSTPAAAEPVPPPVPTFGTVVVGSRIQGSGLYVNDERPVLARGIKRLTLPPGPVRLSIRSTRCARWDTTFTVVAGTTHIIGARPIKC